MIVYLALSHIRLDPLQELLPSVFVLRMEVALD